MSHHLDSPLSRKDPRLNITDQYVFDSGDSTTFVMNAHSSLAGPVVGADFHPEARYEFKIQAGSDLVESITYRFTFDEHDDDGSQSFSVSLLTGGSAHVEEAEGEQLAAGRTNTVVLAGGTKIWAGRVLDPFYLDLSLLGKVTGAVQRGEPLLLPTGGSGVVVNSFAGSSVATIVLQVPHSDSRLFPGTDVRVWSLTTLATDAGGWHQVNRAGLPMVWPIFRPDASEEASEANTTRPESDDANYRTQIAELVTSVTERLGTATDPAGYGHALADLVTPDLLPYTVGTPAALSFLGINGRGLGDNAPEVMFSLALNQAFPTGLTAESAVATRTSAFPYLVPASG